jgi:UPF0755 protein
MSTEFIIEPTFGDVSQRLKKGHFLSRILILFLLCIGMTTAYLLWLEGAPTNFPINTDIVILPGTSVKGIAEQLKREQVVKSSWLLYAAIVLEHEPGDLKASTYRFKQSAGTRAVALQLTKGDFDNDLVTFTHIEGESVIDVAARAAQVLPNFDTATFITLGKPFEGKLFPDTYRIPTNFTALELLELMQKTYEDKIASLRDKINISNMTEIHVITMASILEREANSPESMKMVAGILRNRLAKGMYLQVDASLEYSLHKTLQELTAADLEVDSPYNTYTNPGLPPTPIGNPGLTAITAVLEPTPSEYLYYITDSDGNFHYAKTFEAHKANIAQYLR